MAIDMEKMRERMTSLKNNGNSTSNKFWRPKDGEQTLRIVPPSDGDPFRDYWFHYNVGDTPGFLSPKKTLARNATWIILSDNYGKKALKKASAWLKSSRRDNDASPPSLCVERKKRGLKYGASANELMKLCWDLCLTQSMGISPMPKMVPTW